MTNTFTPAEMREMADKVAGACPRRGQAGHVCGDCLCSHAASMLRYAADALDASVAFPDGTVPRDYRGGPPEGTFTVAAPLLAPSSELEPREAAALVEGLKDIQAGRVRSLADIDAAAPREPQPSSAVSGYAQFGRGSRYVDPPALRERVLQPGDVVHIHGIPVELRTQAIGATAPGNWSLIHQARCQTQEVTPSSEASAPREPREPHAALVKEDK